MRFLLHPAPSSVAAKRTTGKLGTAVVTAGQTESPTATTTATATATATNTRRLIQRWGQQCGVSCGCLLRLEMQVDGDTDRVLAVQSTTKRIVQVSSPSQQQRRTRRRLLQCVTPSPCSTLRILTQRVTDYMPGRFVWQLANEVDFTNARSSPAFVAAVLLQTQQEQQQQCSSDQAHQSMTLLRHHNIGRQPSHPQRSWQSTGRGTSGGIHSTSDGPLNETSPCFDLVEDAFAAVSKGSIAASRQLQQQEQHLYSSNNHHHNPLEWSVDPWDQEQSDDDSRLVESDIDNDDYDYERNDNLTETRMSFLSFVENTQYNDTIKANKHTSFLHKKNKNNGISNNTNKTKDVIRHHFPKGDNQYYFHWTALDLLDWAEQERVQTSTTKRNNTHSIQSNMRCHFHWTALDWIDWAEQERIRAATTATTKTRSTSSFSFLKTILTSYRPDFTDWVSYVDASNNNYRHHPQQQDQEYAYSFDRQQSA